MLLAEYVDSEEAAAEPDAPVLQEEPDPVPEVGTETKPSTCSVCAHEQAGEIQAALDAGEPLRAIESKYGVSRSALSRHGGHG